MSVCLSPPSGHHVTCQNKCNNIWGTQVINNYKSVWRLYNSQFFFPLWIFLPALELFINVWIFIDTHWSVAKWYIVIPVCYSSLFGDCFLIYRERTAQSILALIIFVGFLHHWNSADLATLMASHACTVKIMKYLLQNYVLKWKRFANSLFFFPALWKNFILIKFPFLRSHSITPSGVYRSESLGELDISSFSAIHFHLLLCIARYMIIVCYSLH